MIGLEQLDYATLIIRREDTDEHLVFEKDEDKRDALRAERNQLTAVIENYDLSVDDCLHANGVAR